MKPIAFALLFFILPVTARSQDQSPQQRRSSGKKIQWLGVGSLLGGAGLAVFGAVSGKETVTHFSSTPNANCTSVQNASASAVACVVFAGAIPVAGGSGSAPLAPPSSPGGSSTPLSVITLSTPALITTEERRTVNWKIVAPAIGAASAGAFLAHLGHARVKKAELSVRPNGALQLAFRW